MYDDTDGDTMDDTVMFVGECLELEKPYFRLTTFPRKESVRPLPVLQRALVTGAHSTTLPAYKPKTLTGAMNS